MQKENVDETVDSEPETESVNDKSLLKPKVKRVFTPEQKEAMAERMRKVNSDRIANAKHTREKKKELEKLNRAEEKAKLKDDLKEAKTKAENRKPETKEVKKDVKKDIKKDIKKKKPTIKIINVQHSDSDDSDSDDSDSDDSDSDSSSSDSDISIPQAKIVVINKKSKSKSKGLTKEKLERKVEPVLVPEIKRPIGKFL